jgi:ABC-type multidrug transport system fused ATPase/permease subunit
LLFGLRSPSQGSVRIGGAAVGRTRRARARATLGYAGAEPFLLHATVEENLRYGNPRASRKDVERAAAIADAAEFIEALPQGYATVIGGRGLALSDGQRQRLGLARLVLRDPRILVLDEAFSALDFDTEVRVRRNLWHAFPDRTALVVSHRPVGLDAMHRILFLRDGRLSAIAPGEAASFEDLASRLAPPSEKPR